MIKNNLNRAVSTFLVGTALLASSSTVLSASEYTSLVGIEGGYSGIESEVASSSSYAQNTTDVGNLGLKIGAESQNFRVFVGGRYYFMDGEYDSLATYGVDLQYKFNVSKALNIFVGGSAGMAHAKYQINGENFSRTISDPYYGGDLGVNVNLSELVDLEIGGRYLSLDALNSKAGVDYTLNNIVTGYASIIFKYQLD